MHRSWQLNTHSETLQLMLHDMHELLELETTLW